MPSKDKVVHTNYHTHMYLCRHASGDFDDYIQTAIELGFTELGFSEHAFWNELKQRSERMFRKDYPEYLKGLNNAKKKYKDQISIKRGLEIEYFNGKDSYYEQYLNEVDYLILGQHYIELNDHLISVYRIKSYEELKAYKEAVVKAINSGYFKIIAHPDLFLFSQKELSDEIIDLCEEIVIAAKKKNVLLEINANGIRKGRISVNDEVVYRYPRIEFFKLVKKHDAKCIISSDAHKPELLYDEAIENAVKFSRQLGLTVVEELSFE